MIIDIEKLKVAMNGLKKPELARRSEISVDVVFKILNGSRQPRKETLAKIVAGLNKEIIIGGYVKRRIKRIELEDLLEQN